MDLLITSPLPTLSPQVADVVARLDALPGIHRARVFGSLLTRPETAADVDVAFTVAEVFTPQALNAFRPALAIGACGTPRYGLLDVFVRFNNGLWVRDDDSRGFVRARNARALRKAIDEGRPWAEWRRGVALNPLPEAPRRPLRKTF